MPRPRSTFRLPPPAGTWRCGCWPCWCLVRPRTRRVSPHACISASPSNRGFWRQGEVRVGQAGRQAGRERESGRFVACAQTYFQSTIMHVYAHVCADKLARLFPTQTVTYTRQGGEAHAIASMSSRAIEEGRKEAIGSGLHRDVQQLCCSRYTNLVSKPAAVTAIKCRLCVNRHHKRQGNGNHRSKTNRHRLQGSTNSERISL